MKLQKLRTAITLLMVTGILSASSCKDKAKETDNTANATSADTTSMTPATDTSTVVTDEALTTQLKDATKDYPGVTATVTNGEVTLTGTIKRDKLQNLLQAVNALNPKKVNNQLTIE